MAAGIGSFLSDAIEKINQKALEMAAASACIALAGTAKRALPGKQKKDNEKYKDFLRRQMGLIVFVATGIPLRKGGSIRLGFDHPDVRKDAEGYSTLEDIFYHVVRCGLIHESEFPSAVRLGDSLSADGGIPRGILNGLILAVIVAPENRKESLPLDWIQEIKGKQVRLNDFWGKEQELVEYLGLQWLKAK